MITAKWREGFGFYKDVDAQKVAEEIKSIGEYATPKEIVDKARSENTELHKCFEWNDTIAAEKYRLQQARDVVYHLVIKEEVVPQNRPEIRFFVKPEVSKGYKETKLVIKQEDEYTKLLEQAYSELRAFKRKYNYLEELREILDLIN